MTQTRQPLHQSGKTLQLQRDVGRLWLQGHDTYDISLILGMPETRVQSVIRVIRDVLREANAQNLLAMSDQSIAAIDLVRSFCWGEVDNDAPNKTTLLNIILRAEELKAKIQGILTDRLHVRVDEFQTIKLYAIRDEFPNMGVTLPSLPSAATILDVVDGDLPTVPDEVVEASFREDSIKQVQKVNRSRASDRARPHDDGGEPPDDVLIDVE